MTDRVLLRLYGLSAALLVTHEIDSAYWREWDLLGLPGGAPGFLALHVPLLLVVLWGHEQVVRSRRAGAWMSLALAASGLAALVVHGALLLGGAPEFRTAASVTLLVAIGAVAAVQGLVSLGALRRGAAGVTRS